ncbi:MAG: TIGR03545 family protein [Planctomycetaceae bacterium]|nr:TIGR03545 family protein [Planctomycetaceae bacterium]
MIRWKYAVPRLLLALVVLLLIYFGMNPLLRWGIEAFGEQALSLSVDIGDLDASLSKTSVHINDFAIANPKVPNTNLVDADQITLSLDTNALLRRKFVVREGHVQGLRLRGDRDEAAQPVDHWQWNAGGDRLKQEAERWLETLSATLGEQLEAEIAELESVKLAKGLLDSWPDEYKQLEAQVHAVKARIENLRTLFHTRPDNVASALQHYQKTLAELEHLQQEMGDLAEQIDRLPDRVESDRYAILAATQQDVRMLEERFASIRIDQETITAYFLGPEMGRRVVAVTEWVRWVRAHLPDEEPDFAGDRLEGVNILFAGRQPQPDFLIESLRLDGETTIDGKTYSFAAAAAGLTNQPQFYGRPAEIRAQLVGDATFEVHALLDRTGETPFDQIVINCPDLALPGVTLGRKDSIALSIRPGNTQLWIGINLSGDRIAGTMLLKQSGVELTPSVAERLGGQRLADNLALAAESLREIEIQVDLAGPLDHPEWVLRSNLGRSLSEGLNRAATAELEHRRNQAAQLVQVQIDKELNKFRNRLATDEEILQTRLRLSQSEIDQLGQLIAQRVPSADKILTKAIGDRLPLRF